MLRRSVAKLRKVRDCRKLVNNTPRSTPPLASQSSKLLLISKVCDATPTMLQNSGLLARMVPMRSATTKPTDACSKAWWNQ